jgi:hypothetical protein
MFIKKKNLMVVAACTLMLTGASMLPGELSLIPSAYAKDGGGGGGGNGGGNGGGHGGGNGAGNGGGHSGGNAGGLGGGIGLGKGLSSDHAGKAVGKGLSSDHAAKAVSKGLSKDHATKAVSKGLKIDHAGKAVQGLNGNHYGSIRNDDNGHGVATSAAAHSDTKGLAKAAAIADTTPGVHNTKGLSNAVESSIKNDH